MKFPLFALFVLHSLEVKGDKSVGFGLPGSKRFDVAASFRVMETEASGAVAFRTYMPTATVPVVVLYKINHATFLTLFRIIAEVRFEMVGIAVLIIKFLVAPIAQFEVVVYLLARKPRSNPGAVLTLC